jgi:hypothetical protein
MPAELSIDGTIVLCRLTDTRRGPTYREADGPHDPCVWIRDGHPGENYWHVYYADEIVGLLKDLSKIDFSSEERKESFGAITHQSERSHYVQMRGRTVSSDATHEFEWEISLGNFWEAFPYLEMAELIERQRRRLEPGVMLPMHPSQAWPSNRLVEYIEKWKDHPTRRPHMFLPIHINRPEEK